MVPWFPWFLEFVPGQLSSVPGNGLIPWHLGVGPTLFCPRVPILGPW